jgi:hypothetical protein
MGLVSREKLPREVYDCESHAEFKETGKRLEDRIENLRQISPSMYSLDNYNIN